MFLRLQKLFFPVLKPYHSSHNNVVSKEDWHWILLQWLNFSKNHCWVESWFTLYGGLKREHLLILLVYHENQISYKNTFSVEPGRENLWIDLKFYFAFLLLEHQTGDCRKTTEVWGPCGSQGEGVLWCHYSKVPDNSHSYTCIAFPYT